MDKKRHIALGKKGEDLAVELLKKNGYKILKRDYKITYGQIDIIAKEKDTICFIEVKTRKSNEPENLSFSLDARKIKHISRAAVFYLKSNKLLNKPARFDVVWVVDLASGPHLNILKNAFELDRRYSY